MLRIYPRSYCVILGLQAVALLVVAGLVHAQGLRTSPYSAPSVLRGALGRGAGLDLTPSNPLGPPGSSLHGADGDSSLYVSNGLLRDIFPLIPNLQFGYLYNSGSNVRIGRFTADYLAPFGLSKDSVVFGEAHTEFQSFWNTPGFNNRVNVSLGGGYRAILRDRTLLGVNGFYDTTRLGGQWYSSGSAGVEMAALLPGNDALDLNFNWYGRLLNGNVIRSALNYGLSNFDAEAGYSHELWEGGPDLRLKIAGYQFDAGARIDGYNAGAEFKTRDGVLTFKYEVGNDRINGAYQTVGGFLNVGFGVDMLFKGESPFEFPEPIFKSPRNLRRFLVRNVARNSAPGWTCHLPGYSVLGYTTLRMNVTYPATPALPDPIPTTVSTLRLHWCGVLYSVDLCGVYVYSAHTVAVGGD
jgi:hypothetical protein